ncbi:MAG: hypothetical protein IKF38_03095 [Clostridia bacterium]|nr:hypothetical protein [Clostridia bacterium]
MNLIEVFKNFFKRLNKKEQVPLLNEGEAKETQVTQDNFRQKYKVSQPELPKEPSLESCFEEYIKQYILQEKLKSDSSVQSKSYRAFRRMFCGNEESVGNNLKNQFKLEEKLRKQGYILGSQADKEGRVVFKHIMGNIGVEDNKMKQPTEKLYINCDRENIALLTGEIVQAIKGVVGEKLQLKFVSEQQISQFIENEEKSTIKNYQRNDKIVIYAENHAKAEIISDLINQLRMKKPQLFSKTKVNPLLPKKYGFIGMAREKARDCAKFPSGVAKGVTYNDYMADIMYNSIASGFDKYFEVDYNNCEENIEERMNQYMPAFLDMMEEQKEAILKECKQIFLEVCTKDKVNTIYTPTNEENQIINKKDMQRD